MQVIYIIHKTITGICRCIWDKCAQYEINEFEKNTKRLKHCKGSGSQVKKKC